MAIGNYYPKIITKIAIFADIGKFCDLKGRCPLTHSPRRLRSLPPRLPGYRFRRGAASSRPPPGGLGPPSSLRSSKPSRPIPLLVNRTESALVVLSGDKMTKIRVAGAKPAYLHLKAVKTPGSGANRGFLHLSEAKNPGSVWSPASKVLSLGR